MKNPITTIQGIILVIVIPALVLFGVIDADQEGVLGDYVVGTTSGIMGIISIFSADPGKEKSGP